MQDRLAGGPVPEEQNAVCPRRGQLRATGQAACGRAAGPPGTYLRVLPVAAADLRQALAGRSAGGRGREGLLHLAGAVLETALDTVGLVELVDLAEPQEGTQGVTT